MVPGRHNCFDTGMSRIIVITGTDTGVGKTLLTGLLAAHLVREGVQVAALKPICSGDREDARFVGAQARKGYACPRPATMAGCP